MQGHEVLGIELSEKAIEDFFNEHQFDPDVSEQGPFKVYRAGSIELWCGDFFELTAGDVADCAALYDRAALIALPPAMREQYAAHLTRILPKDVAWVVDYPGLRPGANARSAVCCAG